MSQGDFPIPPAELVVGPSGGEFEKYNYDAYCHNLIIIPTGEKNADGEDLYKLDTLYDGLISIITSIIGVEESANTEETAEGEGGA